MTDWGSGYVTDVAYMAGYYPFQSPYHLEASCLLRSVRPPAIGPGLSYVELGCGRGFGALILAASNPDWTVTAVDFHPAHVADARRLATEAGLRNVIFLEADLADPATSALVPQADIVSLHGVWSWVPPAVRAGITALLRARLRAGGLAHVSYNSLPGWQGALGMQRLLREAGLRGGTRSDRQAQAGMDVVRALAATDATHLGTPVVRTTLEHSSRMPHEYVAHEYMNASWSPFFHMDVCADLAPARLDWAASVQVIDSFPELSLSPEQRAMVDRYDEPAMRELVRDTCQDRLLRNDVFVRGMARLGRAERDARLRAVTLALVRPAAAFRFEVPVPAGRAGLERPFYEPMVAHLSAGPCTIGELLDLPDVVGRRDNPAELAGMMIGSQQAIPVAPLRRMATPEETALNRGMARRFEAEDALNARAALASGALGTGLPCSVVEMAAWRRLSAGLPVDPDATAREIMPYGDAQDLARMAGTVAEVGTSCLPLWRASGIVVG